MDARAEDWARQACALARATTDAVLVTMIERATALDAGAWRAARRVPLLADDAGRPVVSVETFRPRDAPALADRAKRAHAWRKVFARLAGDPREGTVSLTRRGLGRHDGAAWITAALRVSARGRMRAWCGTMLTPTDPRLRRHAIPPETAHDYETQAAATAGCAWSVVAWGRLGTQRAVRVWCDPLPPDRRGARRLVRAQLREASTAALAEVQRHRGRLRLEDYAAHVVAYLLRVGHAELGPLPWSQAVAAFGDSDHALRDHLRAARRLVRGGWRRLGTA